MDCRAGELAYDYWHYRGKIRLSGWPVELRKAPRAPKCADVFYTLCSNIAFALAFRILSPVLGEGRHQIERKKADRVEGMSLSIAGAIKW